jgi:TRAP-type uncharacterized transport system substrate-binding protein
MRKVSMRSLNVGFALAVAAVCAGVGASPAPSLAQGARQQVPANAARSSANEARMKDKINGWTVGLAAGQLEGAPLRFSTELARVMDDGDNMRVVSIVTRGVFDNIFDLLYLRGVDAAIVYGDVLEHFRKDPQISNISKRINYVMNLFPSEVHVFVRPEIKSLADLAGKPVNFNTAGTAAAYSGPIIFDRLGIKVDAKFDPHPVALGELAKSDKYAAVVFVSSKPLDPFVKRKWPEGFKFLPIPLNERLEEYYAPADLDAADYPDLIAKGQKIATISVPAVLAVYDWSSDSERHRRMVRFVDYLFARFPKLQQEAGYHPKWKDLNLAATVPGWTRFRPMQSKLDEIAPPLVPKPVQAQAPAARQPVADSTGAEQEKRFRQFLEQSKPAPKQ